MPDSPSVAAVERRGRAIVGVPLLIGCPSLGIGIFAPPLVLLVLLAALTLSDWESTRSPRVGVALAVLGSLASFGALLALGSLSLPNSPFYGPIGLLGGAAGAVLTLQAASG